MTEFIESRLLEKVAYGTESGTEYNTQVVTLRSGVTRRNSRWSVPLDRFSVIYNILRPEDRELVVKAFRACRGRAVGFRFKDPLDYTAEAEPLGIAAGGVQTVQLIKTYLFGTLEELRYVSKPVANTVQLYADGVPIASTVGLTTGLVTFSATAGQAITWSGEFDKPVCFSDDRLMWSLDTREGGVKRLASTNIDLEEIRL